MHVVRVRYLPFTMLLLLVPSQHFSNLLGICPACRLDILLEECQELGVGIRECLFTILGVQLRYQPRSHIRHGTPRPSDRLTGWGGVGARKRVD